MVPEPVLGKWQLSLLDPPCFLFGKELGIKVWVVRAELDSLN
jgi:hypothetical protein